MRKWAKSDVDFRSFSYSVGDGDLNFFLQIIYLPNKLCQNERKIASLYVLQKQTDKKTQTIKPSKPCENLSGLNP